MSQEQIQVPKGWEAVKLLDVAEIQYGKNLPVKELEKNGYPVFGANGIIGYYKKYSYADKQLLISCRGAYSGTINISPEKCFITNNSLVVTVKNQNYILKYFLFYALKRLSKKIITGSAQPQITIKSLEDSLILLPPLPIQKKIVQKLDEILGQLEEKKKEIIENQKHLEKYSNLIFSIKQMILENAYRGKLTDSTKFPNFIELLDHISKKYNESLTKKQIKLISYNTGPLDKSELFTIPPNWIWVKLGKLIHSMRNGIYKSSKYYGSGIPCLRMYNIDTNGEINLNKIKMMELTDKEREFYALQHNDLLLNRVNSRELVGKTAIIPEGLNEIIFESKNIRVRLWSSFVNPMYVNYWLQTKFIRDVIEERCKKTCGMATISQPLIAELPIPLPSYEEQNEIVRKIINLQKSSKTIQKTYNKIIHSTNDLKINLPKLQSSILNTAFSGKLVQ